jgi:hypothetical protein
LDIGRAVIHYNAALSHQVQLADCLQRGFESIGIDVFSTPSVGERGNTHVCLGPWYALRRWSNWDQLIYIDRAYWGDPDCVSLHWFSGGEKVFSFGQKQKRDHPELLPTKNGSKRIFLCDYGQEPFGDFDSVRYHPAQKRGQRPLAEDLADHDIAIGRKSTALVDALIAGLKVECSDPNSPVYGIKSRSKRINDLAWHNWNKDELASGEALEWLLSNK